MDERVIKRIIQAIDAVPIPIVRRNKGRATPWEVLVIIDPEGPVSDENQRSVGAYAFEDQAQKAANDEFYHMRNAAATEAICETTPEMIRAGALELIKFNLDHQSGKSAVKRIYLAMVSADISESVPQTSDPSPRSSCG